MGKETMLNNGLFEALAEASPVVYIYMVDLQSMITRWSMNAVDYFALPDEYTEHTVDMWMPRLHPEDADSYYQDIIAVVSGKKDKHDCQYRVKNKYGEYVWIECKGSVVKDENGKGLLLAGMIRRLDVQNQYDPQTGMLTSLAFYSWRPQGEAGTIVQFNLDGYRKIIATYGFASSKELLGIVADRIKACCKPSMKVYRFGADEFVVVCPGGTEESTRELFHSVADNIRMVRLTGGSAVRLSVSAGAIKYPEDGTDKDEIIEKLDYSLVYVKKNCIGNMIFYSQKIADEQKRGTILKEDLINSVQNGCKGFELFYQPLVSSENGKIIGCEALLRWKGEKIQNSYPDEFIKVLEETGYIRQVGFWVMEQAMLRKKEWEEKYGELVVSFNVSYQQFMDRDFASNVIEKAAEIGVKTDQMIIELTESCQVMEPETLSLVFTKLMKHGFKIALDDFGTAYSSMEMIKKLPADFIKIDHSFVREVANEGHEDDYIIIDELVRLSKRLRRNAIVEGVEDEKVEAIVKGVDASYLQGYHYSKPVCKDDFETLLEHQK